MRASAMAAGLLLLYSAEASGEGVKDLPLDVDVTKIPEEVVETLARDALPIEVDVAAGETIGEAVQRHCARIGDSYLGLVRERILSINSSLKFVSSGHTILDATISPEKYLRIPFCFERRFQMLKEAEKKLEAARDHYNEEKLRRVLRTPYAYVASASYRQTASLDSGGSLEFSHRQVKAAEAEYARVFTSREIVASISPERFETVRSTFSRLGVDMDVQENRGRLVTHDDPGPNKRDCKYQPNELEKQRVSEPDVSKILQILLLNKRIRENMKPQKGASSPTILIVDSGLMSPTSPQLDGRIDGWTEEGEPHDEYEFKHHGTHVAFLALGGFDFSLVNAVMDEAPLRVRIANVVRRLPSSDGEQAFGVRATLISKTARDTESSTLAHLVNMSVSFSKSPSGKFMRDNNIW